MRPSLGQIGLASVVLVLCAAGFGYYSYANLGVTSWEPYSGSELTMIAARGHQTELLITPEGPALVCVKTNSTAPYSIDIYIDGELVRNQSLSDPVEYCAELRGQVLNVTLTNLTDQPALMGSSSKIDGSPFRKIQMLFAPLFTLLPAFAAIVYSSYLTKVRVLVGRSTVRLSWLYYLGLLPLLATVMLLQLSLILHSATGGAFITPLEYYTYPLSYIEFYVGPSQALLTLFALSVENWLAYLGLAALLAFVVYGVWRWLFKPTTRKIADLLTRRDFVGLVSYYYLTGALFAVVLMGVAAYGPEGTIEWFSIPYVGSLTGILSPLSSLFGLSMTSFKVTLHLMLIGVVLAMLSRILLALDPSLPRGAFSKTLTAISFLTLPALAASPKFAQDYYLSLASIGFSVIPFFAFCVAVSLIHSVGVMLVTSLRARAVTVSKNGPVGESAKMTLSAGLVGPYKKLAWSLALSAVMIGIVDSFLEQVVSDVASQMVTRGGLYVFLVILTIALPRLLHVVDLHELLRGLKVTIACLVYSIVIEFSVQVIISFFVHLFVLTL